jgi:hypothetical protein
MEGSEDYSCSGRGCGFVFAKVICRQALGFTQACKLLRDRRTDLISNFISKADKSFAAYLVLDDANRVTFEFPEREAEEIIELPAVKRRPSEECKPLVAAATKHLFHNNPFRITGLAVDATTREISKHGDKLKLMEELGEGEKAHTNAFARKTIPTLEEIREAIQRLKDPESRIIDEFFWFWPQEFGQSKADPAIQALASGKMDVAIEIWRGSEKDPNKGAVALHNIAVAYHVTALDWDNYSIDHEVPEDQRQEIINYWQRSFRRWKLITADDRIWEIVVARIRQMEDGRLTTGFARRMRNSLPQALNKINVEIAMAYAEAGKLDQARLHVQSVRKPGQGFETGEDQARQHLQNVREVGQGFEAWEEMAQLVLTPSKKRLKEQIQRSKDRAESNPSDAADAAQELLAQSRPCLELFNLFFETTSEFRSELFDEAAQCCNHLQFKYHEATQDHKTSLKILEDALELATGLELRKKIEDNISTVADFLAFEPLKPLFDGLSAIAESKESAREKLIRIQQEILPHISKSENMDSKDREVLDKLASGVALVLRGLSIDAHNEHGDTELALELIQIASQFAREPDLQKKITEDFKQLTEIKQNQDSHNLQLQIRDDRIEVTRAGFRYNDQFINAKDITGIRFGIGVFDVYCHIDFYTLGIRGQEGNEINIDFKRVLRSKDQARKDLNAAIDAILYHLVPGLCTRIAKTINAGHEQQLGECWLTAEGIRGTAGALIWKGEVVIPWSDLRFGIGNGHLTLRADQQRNFTKSYEIRTVWNAAIFEQIAKTLAKTRS